jgi:glycosyltransferase involved in cell wall biosynthesis
MTPAVSVIIVSYNRLPLLHRAIRSALAQTLVSREVIVIDNCSDFDVHAALAEYGDTIRVIRNSGNHGCGHARNAAVREARGEFVAFLDDDDYWKPRKLERQLRAIGGNLMTTCGQEFIPRTRFNVQPIEQVTLEMLRENNPICGPSGFFCRRDLFDKVTFDESLKYAEDWDFMIQVLAIGTIGYVAEPLLFYTFDGGSSMTSAGRGRSWEEIQYRFAAADKHRAVMGERHYRVRCANITLAHILSRRDRFRFIGHAIQKAGLLATSAALAQKIRVRLSTRAHATPVLHQERRDLAL